MLGNAGVYDLSFHVPGHNYTWALGSADCLGVLSDVHYVGLKGLGLANQLLQKLGLY